MSLNNFYKLRRNFIILGLTGKMRSGSDLIVKLLTQEKLNKEQLKFLNEFQGAYKDVSDSESRKIRRIVDFYKFKDNWIKFEVLDYRNVVLLFILHYCYDNNVKKYSENIVDWIYQLGSYKQFKTPRFGSDHPISSNSKNFLKEELKQTLLNNLPSLNIQFKKETLLEDLKENTTDFFFSEEYKSFSSKVFDEMDGFSPFLRYKLLHVISYILRRFGTLDISTIKEDNEEDGLDNIYTIADVINRLIKNHRNSKKEKTAHVIIDRLKNSYELMYFKEKYSGFYMIGTNSDETCRKNRIQEKFKRFNKLEKFDLNQKLTLKLDKTEFQVEEFKIGKFESFDVENCLQKVDYHTYLSQGDIISLSNVIKDFISAGQEVINKEISKTNKFYVYQPFLIQTLKLTALILQPGLIQPTYIERIMQMAHLAKLNSGCISRQVGAVITDSHFSVKGIGWNEVPLGQVPCSLRDLRDLKSDTESFSNLEIGKTEHSYKDGEKFSEKLLNDFNKSKVNLNENLKGRACTYCFKSFHNTYEGKSNQVHTRSLHAEENAMLQITKYGGQGIENGNLFTTASPCELCSKKAFQLGVKNIFYIDLYPGISRNHILEGGRKKDSNPNLYQYQGAIGRGYQKLYMPFMSLKDETILRTNIKPTEPPKKSETLEKELKYNWKLSDDKIKRISEIIQEKE